MLDKKMDFQVSVIIPAYNAEKFISKAINSALIQEEVKEVIVVDDGSVDRTNEIVRRLMEKNSRIRFFVHPGGKNKGRAATRNLGIKKASFQYIAFLDSDDYYLKDRFKQDEKVFLKNPIIDGVYNAIGVEFYRKPKNKEEEERLKLYSIKYFVQPRDLFLHMWPRGQGGSFSGNGLTVKREFFKRVGLFNEDLEVAEDSEMWIRMALKGTLVSGKICQPVAVRGVHEKNVFTQVKEPLYQLNYFLMYSSLLDWAVKEGMKKEVIRFFWEMAKEHFYQSKKSIFSKRLDLIWNLAKKNPYLFFKRAFIQSFGMYSKYVNIRQRIKM